eukprot:350781-Pleurochrysis_carterae.AAC.1
MPASRRRRRGPLPQSRKGTAASAARSAGAPPTPTHLRHSCDVLTRLTRAAGALGAHAAATAPAHYVDYARQRHAQAHRLLRASAPLLARRQRPILSIARGGLSLQPKP